MSLERYSEMPQRSKYDALLSSARDYVKVKAVDTPRTIFLINKAKGDRPLRDFAAAANTTAASLSRILNGLTIELGSKTIAGVVCGADPAGNVDLDRLMDAQGRIPRQSIGDFDLRYNRTLRQVVIDELLSAGNSVKMGNDGGNGSDFSLEIGSVSGAGAQPFTCDFAVRTCPILKSHTNVDEIVLSWLNQAVVPNFITKNERRFALIADNPLIYQKITKRLESVRISNRISILLVSPRQRRVLSEFIIPLSDGSDPQGLFALSAETGDDSLEKIWRKEIRAIFIDEQLRKGCAVSCPEAAPSAFLQPDFVIASRSRGHNPFVQAFVMKKFTDAPEVPADRQAVRAWLYRTMSYYYTGGRLGKISLVTDSEQDYELIADEFRNYTVKNKISVILISASKQEILREYLIPQSSEKN